MNIDHVLVKQTEACLIPEAPPETSPMEWTGRCRWLALFLILLTGLGLWHQNWYFFSAGVLGQFALFMMSLQFRLDAERLLPSGGASWSQPFFWPLGPLEPSFNPSASNPDISSEHSIPRGLRLQWKPEESTTFRSGQGGELTLLLQSLRTSLQLHHLKLRHSVYASSTLDWGEQKYVSLLASRADITVTWDTPVVGKFRIHGLEFDVEDRWHLFRAFRYVRVPLLFRVLPSIPLRKIDRHGRRLRLIQREQSGAPQKRAGAGTELRDIRDYRPGDARRNIVWKHSVRLQKLLCREFESETLMSSYLLLDIGQSMRQGIPGHRPIDYANEVVAAFSKASLASRDAVGLISFDGEIFRHDNAASGQRQLHRILLHLEELHQITDYPFSQMRLSHLAGWVGRFLFREGLLSRQDGQLPPTHHETVAYVWDLVWRHPELGFPKGWESDRQLVDKVLRYACRVLGIELPYRYHQWVTQKAVGLQESIEKASSSLHAGQLIAVLSDLDDIIHWDGILRSLKLVRQRRQHLVFLCPFTPWFEAEEAIRDQEQDKMLREIFILEQWRRRQRVERLAGQWHIPILSLEPKVAPATLLYRLQRLRFGGRL